MWSTTIVTCGGPALEDTEVTEETAKHGETEQRSRTEKTARCDGRREATRANESDRKTRNARIGTASRVFRSDPLALVGVLRTPTHRTRQPPFLRASVFCRYLRRLQ